MIAIAFMLFVGFLVIVALALMATRSAALEVEATSTRLHRPGAETLVYDVPNGQDPVDLTVALAQAGFVSVEDIVEGMTQVLVDCPHGRLQDRPRVRAVIEKTRPPGAAGVGVRIDPVRFADEL